MAQNPIQAARDYNQQQRELEEANNRSGMFSKVSIKDLKSKAGKIRKNVSAQTKRKVATQDPEQQAKYAQLIQSRMEQRRPKSGRSSTVLGSANRSASGPVRRAGMLDVKQMAGTSAFDILQKRGESKVNKKLQAAVDKAIEQAETMNYVKKAQKRTGPVTKGNAFLY